MRERLIQDFHSPQKPNVGGPSARRASLAFYALERKKKRERDNVGASIIRIGVWGLLYYNYNPILESERERERETERERESERERERENMHHAKLPSD